MASDTSAPEGEAAKDNPTWDDLVIAAGDRPAQTLNEFYASITEAMTASTHNANAAQQQTNVIAQAATVQSLELIYAAFPTASRCVAAPVVATNQKEA
jgi:hypothetical protein